MMIKECIVLAGGLGTRLRSAVPDLPKCMAPVAGKPFLQHVVDYLSGQGIEHFIFSLGYMHDVIESFLKEHYPNLSYTVVLEESPMGTGGAILLSAMQANGDDIL
ncbi:MAG TPA: NTP transferase domain-containing protein, partial [Ferruginibacter sp.]|nr:NTP transferase domain-containing protein [Ferruginibacter sp.]